MKVFNITPAQFTHLVAAYGLTKAAVLHDLERRYLADVLARTAGNLSAASRESGIDRKHLRTLARKHGLVDGPDED